MTKKGIIVVIISVVLVIVLAVCAACAVNFFLIRKDAASSENSKDIITIEQAKQIALTHAGISEDNVQFTKEESDSDGGKKVYEIEFESDDCTCKTEIDAKTGDIIKWEVDYEKKFQKNFPLSKNAE